MNMKLWEELLGPLWSPTRETEIFTKLEKYNGRTNNQSARGYSGRLDIRQTPVHPTDMAEKLVTAMERATGYQRILDYNDPNTPIGPFTRWQLYQEPNGIRASSDTAFLSSDVMNEKGEGVNGRRLKVNYKSTVLRIIFKQKRAVAVEYLKEGKCRRVYARKKIILSAGIKSPKLLMLSGIGPEYTLKKANIPIVVKNENVGKNLTTHEANMVTFTTNPNDRARPINDPNALYTAGAFLPDPTPGADQHRRGVQIFGLIADDGNLNVGFFLSEPKSKGKVMIQNNDPLKIGLANEGFLKDSSDLRSIKNVFRVYIQQIAYYLQQIDPLYQLISPSPNVLNNDKRLEEFIKDNLLATHHIQGTLRMARNPREGVVNEKGEVYGVKNLIVADDSIAPFVSDGNTSAPAYFIGANIADQLMAHN